MKLSKLKEIIKILEESKIEEIEIKGLFTKVRVAKKSTQQIKKEDAAQNIQTIEIPTKTTKEKEEGNFVYIKTPMVGTFYRASSPGGPPYVEVGDKVTPKKKVCTIEAMKIFNEIEAGVSGIISEILVKDGEHVEYGQSLFKVIPQ